MKNWTILHKLYLVKQHGDPYVLLYFWKKHGETYILSKYKKNFMLENIKSDDPPYKATIIYQCTHFINRSRRQIKVINRKIRGNRTITKNSEIGSIHISNHILIHNVSIGNGP